MRREETSHFTVDRPNFNTVVVQPKGYKGPVGPPQDRPPISSVRVIRTPGHDHVHVWNRGGKAGVLTVTLGDGPTIASFLIDPGFDDLALPGTIERLLKLEDV